MLMRPLSELAGSQTESDMGRKWKKATSSVMWSSCMYSVSNKEEFSACLELFLPTNYSSCSPQAPAVNPRISWWCGQDNDNGQCPHVDCRRPSLKVAEQLAYYVHVSGTVITEETFDEGRAVWHSAGRPHPELCRVTCLHAPLVTLSTYWEKSIKDYSTNMW
ncbi:dynein heavy chain 2, axonemal [Lates japonicus]|uniref:Dynein heavy chain 2, axonemal n=1 Tax=Lates japonicus TaxID=270547 RepID=A0AAD3MHK1_LATJO|nr:dynein heavy chain 2, axonemal [Lates japonicus]